MGVYNRRRQEQQRRIKMMFAVSALVVLLLILFVLLCSKMMGGNKKSIVETVAKTEPVSVIEEYLEPNEFSRPQTPLEKVNGIVVHYTANPGTDAEANRNYFNGLADGLNAGRKKPVYASSHFVIGLDGKIIQCIPLNEISYASNDRNNDTISIECCHPDETGKFTDDTYESLINLAAWLCGEYNVHSDDIIRHYDITGKLCPKYYVEHEKTWLKLKQDIFNYIDKSHI